MKILIADIQRAVCDDYNISRRTLLSETRWARILEPRQLAMALSFELTGQGLTAIAKRFERKDHSTVANAICRVEQRRAADRKFDARFSRLRRQLVPSLEVA